MKYNTVVFDLDGTLLNSLKDLMDSLNFSLTLHGFENKTLEQTRNYVGRGVGYLVHCALPQGKDNPMYAQVVEDFKKDYSANSARATKPYPQILELLKKLKEAGLHTAVVSNKYDSAVKKLCKLYFGDLIDLATGETETIRRKPAPDSLLHTIEYFKTDKAHTLYVGDSDVDAHTAQNAGVNFVGVTWGFRTREDMTPFGAKVFIDKPLELTALIK